MKFTKNIIASAVLLATSSMAIAATNTTSIDISVTSAAYVNFTGTLVGAGSSVTLDPATMGGVTTTLGTLGLQSNTTGTCTISFASTNDYKLVHGTDASLDLGVYSITYASVTNTAGTANDYTSGAGGCTATASNFNLTHPALPAVVTAGTYTDTLTMVVTTQ